MKCYTSGRTVSSSWEEAYLPYTQLHCGGNVYPGAVCPLIAHQERCGRPNCRHVTFKVEWVNPAESRAFRSSRTVPIGQLTGSSWRSKVSTSRHTVSSLRELWIGGWSQQPRLRDHKLWVAPPSGATPTTSTSPGRGDRPPSVRGDPSWRESPMESHRGEKSGPRTILGLARTVLPEVLWPRPGALSPEHPGAERSGKNIQTKPRPRLYHGIQPQWSQMNKRVPEGTLHCVLTWVAKRSTCFFFLGVKHPFPGPRPLPFFWQDVCSPTGEGRVRH